MDPAFIVRNWHHATEAEKSAREAVSKAESSARHSKGLVHTLLKEGGHDSENALVVGDIALYLDGHEIKTFGLAEPRSPKSPA